MEQVCLILRITLCVVLWLVTAARRNIYCSSWFLLPLSQVTTGCAFDSEYLDWTRHQRMLDRIDWCLVHPGMMYGVLPLYPLTSVVMPAFEPAFFFAREKQQTGRLAGKDSRSSRRPRKRQNKKATLRWLFCLILASPRGFEPRLSP